MQNHIVGIGVLCVVGALACSSGGDNSGTGSVTTRPPDPGRTYYIQNVTFNADGSHTVTTQSFSPQANSQWRDFLAQTGCLHAAFGLYDYSVGNGPGDEICFGSGAGTVNLSTYSNPGTGTSWAGQVLSYVAPGNDTTPGYGYFSGTSDGTGECSPFSATTSQTNVPEPSYDINYLTAGASACPNPGCPSGDFECTEICLGYYKYGCFPNSDCPTGCDQNYYCEMHMTCP